MIKTLRLCVSIILLCLFTIPALAQEGRIGIRPEVDKPAEAAPVMPKPGSDYAALRSMGNMLVNQVIDPLRVRLNDGRIVQLSGLDIPDLNASNPGDISAKAFAMLKSMLDHKQVTLYQTKEDGESRKNRMGHYLGHLETHDGKFWIQGALLQNGFARIQPAATHNEMAAQMLVLENEAITEKRGLWANDAYSVLTPETADKAMNNWAIVEGTIAKTGSSNNVIFLNFGDDWRKDFTIGVEGEARRQLAKNNITSLNLAGKRVRVHGWVESYNGPYIKLSNAIWLEFLPDAAPPANLPEED